MRKKTIYNLICIEEHCRAPFTAHHPKALRCDKCKAVHLRQKSKEYIQHTRDNERKNIHAILPNTPKLSVREAVIACERYNREHGTRLSYGQFVSQVL